MLNEAAPRHSVVPGGIIEHSIDPKLRRRRRSKHTATLVIHYDRLTEFA
jgi:hypothetical protein